MNHSVFSKKEILSYSFLLGGVIVIFFWDLLFLGHGYYYGDYKQQYYPWSLYLSRHIKNFTLPLWAPEIGCGFPLLAEGQIAAFYPLHWILFLLLPFEFAYPLGILFLFFISGVFTYLFARQYGLTHRGATFTALVFLFSSSYAGFFGGLACFRTLVWFSPCLYFTERLLQSRVWRHAVFLALSFCFSIFGGHPQMASYSLLAVFVYFLLRCLLPPTALSWWGTFMFLAALALGIGLSSCQILPTAELVSLSSRAAATVDFALEKSTNPLSVVTFFWPSLASFFVNDFYLGLWPFCLACFAFFYSRRDPRVIFLAFFGLFFFLLSLGRYNPVYVLLLKLLPLRVFRFPSRFLFFSSFVFSLLAGIGFEMLLSGRNGSQTRFKKIALGLLIAGAIAFLTAHFAARIFGDQILQWAEQYVRNHVFGKPWHLHSLESYLQKLPLILNFIQERTKFTNLYFMRTAVIWFFIMVFSFLFLKENSRRKNIAALFIVAVTLLDLYWYTDLGTGFKGNRIGASVIAPDEVIRCLLEKKEEAFRTYEFITNSGNTHPDWLPNANMLFGYASIGLYTPLATSSYREYLKELGDVDNSSGFYMANKQSVRKNLDLLSLMNVRYLLSRVELDDLKGLSRVLTSSKGDILYENSGVFPRTFLDRAAVLDDTQKTAQVSYAIAGKDFQGIRWDVDEPMRKVFRVDTEEPSFLFFSETFYPGWIAELDGTRVPIYKTNTIFKGMRVPVGIHRAEFRYEPASFRLGVWISLACGLALIFLWFKKSPVKRV